MQKRYFVHETRRLSGDKHGCCLSTQWSVAQFLGSFGRLDEPFYGDKTKANISCFVTSQCHL